LASNGEHRNDHQLATSKHFSKFENIYVVDNETKLLSTMSNLVNKNNLSAKKELKDVSSELISAIKQFIETYQYKFVPFYRNVPRFFGEHDF